MTKPRKRKALPPLTPLERASRKLIRAALRCVGRDGYAFRYEGGKCVVKNVEAVGYMAFCVRNYRSVLAREAERRGMK